MLPARHAPKMGKILSRQYSLIVQGVNTFEYIAFMMALHLSDNHNSHYMMYSSRAHDDG